MPDVPVGSSPDAEAMAERASAAVRQCLKEGTSFRLEAGAGAGKTHALVEALEWLVEHRGAELARCGAQVACITYTNVAVGEIKERVGEPPSVWVSTIHSFLWHLISPFQKTLRQLLEDDEVVQEKLGEHGPSLGSRKIAYDDVGRVRVSEQEVSISHDHVISLAVELLKIQKFRRVWRSRFPVLLLDEYQDTSSELMEAIRYHLLAADPPLQIGLFGDHWQMIYDKVCGAVADDRFVEIQKRANFRSCDAVVRVLNRVRPNLEQEVSRSLANPGQPTDVVVLHTNSWPEVRGTGHYKNALNDDTQDAAVEQVQEFLRGRGRGWQLGHGSTSILRLTNKAVARAEGFSDLLAVFRFPDQLLKRQDPIVDMLAGRVEAAADLVAAGRKTSALETVGWPRDRVKKQEDKQRARMWLEQLGQSRDRGTIGEVVEHLRQFDLLTPSAQRALRRATSAQEEGDDERIIQLRERWNALKIVPYQQVQRWYAYESGTTMLSTKHGVKGAEFDEVVVVFGGGWSRYNFPGMLKEWAAQQAKSTPDSHFTRARNLFYVTISRARYRLALLFLETLPDTALATLRSMVVADRVCELPHLEE